MKRIFAAIGALFVLAFAAGLFADTISGTLRVSPNLTHQGSGTASTLTETLTRLQNWNISGTTDAVSVTKMWAQSITLAGASSTNFDLYGSLTDNFGQSVSFDAVKILAVVAASSNYASIGIGGAASNPMTNWVADSSDIVLVLPSTGFYIFSPTTNGYAVTNGVADVLAVTNNHATSNAYFDIYVLGLGN